MTSSNPLLFAINVIYSHRFCISIIADDDDEAEDVSNVKQVLVIPMTKASKLVGAKIGKDTISSVSLFTFGVKWHIAFAINGGDCYDVQAETLFGCDVEVSEE